MILIAILTLQSLGAQNKIEFTYEQSGNRVQRSIVYGIVKKEPNVVEIPTSVDSLVVMEENSHVKTEESIKSMVTNFKLEEAQIPIYPNPTMGRLTIGLKNFSAITSARVEITDSYGKQVFLSNKAEPVYSVDLSNYAPGYYYINLNIDGVKGSYSVIKQ